MYSIKPRLLVELKKRTTNAFHSVTPELRDKVRLSMQNRALKCIEVSGGKFEYL